MRLAFVMCIVLTLSGCGGNDPDAAPTATAEPDAAPTATAEARTAFELEPGDCLNDPGGLADSLGEVAVVPCDQSHQTEVFAVFDYASGPDEPYPGDNRLTRVAERECRGDRFTEYVGVAKDASELLVLQATPAQDTWAQGDREIVCLLHLGDEPLTASMRGSGR